MNPDDLEDRWLKRALALALDPPSADLAPRVRRRLVLAKVVRSVQVAAAVAAIVALAAFVRRPPGASAPLVAQLAHDDAPQEMAASAMLFAPPPVDDLSVISQQQSAYTELLKHLAEE